MKYFAFTIVFLVLFHQEQWRARGLHLSSPSSLSSPSFPFPTISRRQALVTTSGALTLLPSLSEKALAFDKTPFLQVSVTLAPDVTLEKTAPTSDGQQPMSDALYVTCRPNRADNVPSAILSGTRGKPPPVLAARLENPTFPLQVVLTEDDLTPEGADRGSGSGDTDNSSSSYWWSRDDLVVSGRWDADGVAATRSPEDLVGRTIWMRNSNNGSSNGTDKQPQVTLQLQGRGSFGKFATKKN